MGKHRLVAIGDSLTQGFMSGAIFATDLSYPAIIAQEMGLNSSQFKFPTFNAFGGLPVNMEFLLRRLEERYGRELTGLERFGAPIRLRGWMDQAEDYWERGGGTAPAHTSGTFHNLASWAMTVDDALHLTAGHCARRCAEPTKDNGFNQVPENSFYRTALGVLNPAQRPDLMDRTVLGCVRDLAADGGVENLLVALGANNALGTITRLRIVPTDERVLNDPIGTRTLFNLWQPEHFAVMYRKMAEEVERLGPERVFLATVPHVTIAPLARGVGRRPEDRLANDPRYFKFYTYFWITDEAFDVEEHPRLTGEQAQRIDSTIDSYNAVIREIVEEQKAKGLQWFLVDTSNALDRMAYRRYQEIGMEPPGGVYQFPPGWIEALRSAGLPILTTEFFTLKQNRVQRGGIVSLDGVHPTTMGYALIAHEFIKVMREEAGVPFFNSVTGAERPDPHQLDFAKLLRRDTLVSTPPGLLDDAIAILNWLEDWVGLGAILGNIA